MKTKTKRIIGSAALALSLAGATALTACSDPGPQPSDAEVVNRNLTTDADNFKILRRVTFYNAIKDVVILQVEGYCSVEPGSADERRMQVVCKVGNGYKRNALGDSDNVLWFYEQLDAANVSPDHYKFVIKPATLIPNIEVR